MGAGILECDVTFTNDAALVCRHAQCDLHTTTNIVVTDLASKCTVPPIVDAEGNLINGPEIKCCTSDITLAEFKTLKGKMDAADRDASTIEGYLGGTADFRTDLYATGSTLLSAAEAAHLFEALGRKHTPELKGGDPKARDSVEDIFGSQANYAQALIDVLVEVGVHPENVWAQSFNYADILYWVNHAPHFGKQAVYLVSDVPTDDPLTGSPPDLVANPPALSEFLAVSHDRVNIIAPPMPVLLTTDAWDGRIVPSTFARRARKAGLDIISWTTERSGRIVEDVLEGGGTFYYSTTLGALENDGDILKTIDVLAQDVKILGLFSDWPATTTFYANCKDIPALEAKRQRRHGHWNSRGGRGREEDRNHCHWSEWKDWH